MRACSAATDSRWPCTVDGAALHGEPAHAARTRRKYFGGNLENFARDHVNRRADAQSHGRFAARDRAGDRIVLTQEFREGELLLQIGGGHRHRGRKAEARIANETEVRLDRSTARARARS